MGDLIRIMMTCVSRAGSKKIIEYTRQCLPREQTIDFVTGLLNPKNYY